MSAPDGQNDAPKISMTDYTVSNILRQEYIAGRLIYHHGQNLWWINNNVTSRPAFSHCLPIGIENRALSIGKRLSAYIDALKRNVVHRRRLSVAERSARPLLLISFHPKTRIPDRQKVLVSIGAINRRGRYKPKNPWYNETDRPLRHSDWLDAIGQHRFVLAPFGHGLDTHR